MLATADTAMNAEGVLRDQTTGSWVLSWSSEMATAPVVLLPGHVYWANVYQYPMIYAQEGPYTLSSDCRAGFVIHPIPVPGVVPLVLVGLALAYRVRTRAR